MENTQSSNGIAGYTVTKHAWRGRYQRFMSISTLGITTHNPTTLEVTNCWEYRELSGISLYPKGGPNQFVINAPKPNKKTPSNMIFESIYYKDILSDIFLFYRQFKCFHESHHSIFNGYKICRNGDNIPVLIYVTPCAIEVHSPTTKKQIAVFFFKYIGALHYINDIIGGFVIQTKFDSRRHAFIVSNLKSGIIPIICDKALNYLGISLTNSNPIYSQEYYATRLGTLGTDEALMLFTTFNVQKLSQKFSQSISRVIGVSELCLVEHDPATYAVVTVRSLKRVYSFIRCHENPQLLGIEWTCGWPRITYYTSPDRDSLLSTFLDAVRISGNIHVSVHGLPTSFDKRFAPLDTFVDEDTEILCMKMLTNSESKIFENIIQFNTNIPYCGFQHAHAPDSLFGEKKEKVILNAIDSILQYEGDFSKLSTVKIEHLFNAIKRLFSSKAGFDSFTLIPKLNERMGSLILSGLKRRDDSVTYSCIEVMNSLIMPLHPNNDLYQEQMNKLSFLSQEKFIKGLLYILRNSILRGSGALVISSILDFLTFIVCLPFSRTTDQEQLNTVLNLITEVGYPLFRLFQHPCPSIVKSAGMLMKSLIEEGNNEISSVIQRLALTEGAFPKHLLTALFTQNTTAKSTNTKLLINRQLSRRLLTLWLRDNETCMFFLGRSFPPGMVSFLNSDQIAKRSALMLSEDREEVSLDVLNKKVVDVFVRQSVEKMEAFFQHWRTRVSERIGVKKKMEPAPIKAIILRNPKPVPPLKENWNLFYEKFYEDHYLPDLIWNHKTREELKDALEAEIRAFSIDKDIGGQIKISWNFEDFQVSYPSLQQEIRIGDFYIKPLIDSKDFKLNDPKTFFTDLYHSYLQSKTVETGNQCMIAMTKLYRFYYQEIGKFNDLPYLIHILKNSRSPVERDLVILFIKELVNNNDNARIIISFDLIVYLVDLATLAHLHSSRATVPLQTLMLEGPYEQSGYFTNEWYVNEGDQQSDPVSINEIIRLYKQNQLNDQSKVWAQGMEGWKPLIEISQLKWAVFQTKEKIMNESDLTIAIIDILIKICRFFPSTDQEGGIYRPVPRAKRLISDVRTLPHLSQLLLTFDPPIVERITVLMLDVMDENPALPQLFITGFYFFLMMYTGSNVTPIAKFLKETHLRQGFSIDKEKTRNTLLSHSILSPLLPEAMVSFLESYEPVKFAEIFLGEFNSPEVIWSNNMRRHMMEKISLHLADFTPRLKSNVKSVYMYCPIPHIEYEELRDELFCGKYYLRNLCDTASFPNWPVTDPVQTLRDILDAWKEEVSKKPPPMSMDEAYKSLELETGVRHDDSIVRRAYYKLAMKYHPDKNPDGREIFEQVINAYEYLCSKQVKMAAPSNYNIILILKSQSILFVNYKTKLEPYKYPGYPMLLKTIEMEVADQELFSKPIGEVLILPAVELAHHTISCSSLNAEELRREDGIIALQAVFERCINLITESSKASDLNILICEHVIRCFVESSRFEGFINTIIELPKILQNFSHILMHQENLTTLTSTTVECIVSLCCSNLVQMRVLNTGLIYHLVYFMFLYDYTLAEAGIEVSHETNQQQKFNELAKLSMQALSIMSVSGAEDISNLPISQILNILLTQYLVNKMVVWSPSQFLKNFNSNVENPYLIWDNDTRNQVKDLLEKVRRYNPDEEIENHQTVLKFNFNKHIDEPMISGIYIRIYNKMPTFKIEEPLEFASDLIKCIKEHSQLIFSSFLEQSDVLPGDHRVTLVHDCFTALYNLMSSTSILNVFSNDDWPELCTLFVFKGFDQVNKAALKVLSIFVTDINCVNNIANAGIMGFLNICLENLPDEHQLELSIFQPLFSNSSIVKEAVLKGTLIYLLDIFCADKNVEVRTQIVELFARLLSDRLTGPRIRIILLKFLPQIFIDAILDDTSAALLLFESKQENPELLWNDDTRQHVASIINQMKLDFFRIQIENPSAEWKLNDNFSCFSIDENDLIIAGVHLGRFISQPSWVLRHPRDFMIGLLDNLIRLHQNYIFQDGETLELVTNALCLFLEAQSAMADQIPTLGHLPTLSNIILNSDDGSSLIKSALRVLRITLKNKLCFLELQKTDSWITSLTNSFSKRPDCADLAAEALNMAFQHKSSIAASQALSTHSIPKMLDLLENGFKQVGKPGAARAHLVSALQQLEADPQFGPEISQILARSPIWRDYKNQKHDLFIENPNSVMRITAAPSGIAGYLTAAHNTAPTSLSNANTLRMLTDSLPPKPT